MPLRYQEVKQEIKGLIFRQKPGSRIPSRNFLSRKYQVARNTVDKAIGELEGEGYLRSSKGSGTYVSDRKRQRPLNIGVILPSVLGDMYPQFISGVQQAVSSRNANMILLSSDNSPERQKSHVMGMIEMHGDGYIIIPTINMEQSFDTFWQLKKRGIPFVLCNRNVDGLNVPFIGANHYYGAYLAAKHLIGQGCKKISYFSHRKYSTALERYYGFETALLEGGEAARKGEVILGDYGEEHLKGQMGRIFGEEGHPDGVLCFDDAMAVLLYCVLQEKGMTPGKEVKVVGYDDSNLCPVLPVPLSSVSPGAVEMGRQAMDMLLGMIDGNCAQEAIYLIQPKLVVRKSSLEI